MSLYTTYVLIGKVATTIQQNGVFPKLWLHSVGCSQIKARYRFNAKPTVMFIYKGDFLSLPVKSAKLSFPLADQHEETLLAHWVFELTLTFFFPQFFLQCKGSVWWNICHFSWYRSPLVNMFDPALAGRCPTQRVVA